MSELVLSRRAYRLLDAATKLGGVGLLALALDVGIVSAPGAALVLAGVLLGVCTVFVTKDRQSHDVNTDEHR